MVLEQFTQRDEQIARRYDYGNESMVVVDFGAVNADASVDLVDGTVIVVADDDQYEFDLPDDASDAHTFIRNGVLTVTLEGN